MPLTPEEQKYFESRGAEAPKPEEPATPTQSPTPEPEPLEAEAEPEPEAPPGPDNKGKFVRLAALHEERQRRRDAEARYQTLEQRTNQILDDLRKQQEPEKPQVPQWEQDPLGHTRNRLETQEERLAKLEKFEQQQAQQAQAQQGYQQIYVQAQAKVAEFATKTPDYADAYKFLADSFAKELTAAGYTLPQVQATLTQYENNITIRALQDGANPAERLYAIAEVRGFKKGTVALDPAEKLRTIAAGQKTSKSLSASPGSAKPQLDAKTLADMPADEFKAIWFDKTKRRQLLRQ